MAQPVAVDAWPMGFADRGPIDGVLYGSKKFESQGKSSGFLMWSLRNWLNEKVEEVDPDFIVFESIFINKNKTVSMRLSELKGITEMVAKEFGVDLFEVNLQTWRKHFTGKGNATKDQTIWMCKQRGWSPKDDNAADALGILDYSVFCVKAAERKRCTA